MTLHITIYRTSQAWTADFRHATDASRIHNLFSSYIIATAFTPLEEAEVVRGTLATAYPSDAIVVRD